MVILRDGYFRCTDATDGTGARLPRARNNSTDGTDGTDGTGIGKGHLWAIIRQKYSQ